MVELSKVEKVLDVLGYIPVVSTYSGALRLTIAKTQIVLGAIGLLGTTFADTILQINHAIVSQEYQDYKGSLLQIRVTSVNLLTQGMANFVRGLVEIFAVIGNVALLTYDFLVDVYLNKRKIFAISTDPNPRPMFNQQTLGTIVKGAQQGVETLKETANHWYQQAKDQIESWQGKSQSAVN